MTVTGPDFVALQVRDLERAAGFCQTRLGLRQAPTSPPGAVVFATEPIPFAVREPLPGVDLDDAQPRPGFGVALWLHADDAQALHDELAPAGVPIVAALADGPFGRNAAGQPCTAAGPLLADRAMSMISTCCDHAHNVKR